MPVREAEELTVASRLVVVLPRLRRFAFALCRNMTLAEDLVQAACVRVMTSGDTWEPGTNFDAWVFRILRNLWLDMLRHRKVTGVEADVEEADRLAAGESDSETRVFLQQVQNAMLALPQDMREVVLLVCIEDMSYREAADILGVPAGTVMSRLARARAKLAEVTGYETRRV